MLTKLMCALCTCTMYIHESPPGTFILPSGGGVGTWILCVCPVPADNLHEQSVKL